MLALKLGIERESFGTGGLRRKFPMGGSAKGIPKEVSPRITGVDT